MWTETLQSDLRSKFYLSNEVVSFGLRGSILTELAVGPETTPRRTPDPFRPVEVVDHGEVVTPESFTSTVVLLYGCRVVDTYGTETRRKFRPRTPEESTNSPIVV